MTRKNHDKMKHTSSNLPSFGQLVVLQQRPLRRCRVDAPKLSGNDHGGAAAANKLSSRTTRVNAAATKAQMIKVEQEKKDHMTNVRRMSTSSQALVPYYKSPRLRAKFQAALEGSNNVTMTTTAKSAAVNDSSDIMKKRIGSTTVASEGRKKKSEATKVVTKVTQPTPLKNGLKGSMNQKRHWSLHSSTNCAQTTHVTKKNRVNDDNVDNPLVPSEEKQEKIYTTLPTKDTLLKKRRGRPPKTSYSSSARDKRASSTKTTSVSTTNSKGRGQSLRKGASMRRNTSDRFVKSESPYSPSRTNIKVEKSLPRSARKERKTLRSAQKTKSTTNAATTTYYHCASETTKITSIKELNIVNGRREARTMSAREVRIIKRSYLKQTSSSSSTSMRCINPLQDSTNIVNSRHEETHAHHEKVTNKNEITHSVDKEEVIALNDKEEPSHTVLPRGRLLQGGLEETINPNVAKANTNASMYDTPRQAAQGMHDERKRSSSEKKDEQRPVFNCRVVACGSLSQIMQQLLQKQNSSAQAQDTTTQIKGVPHDSSIGKSGPTTPYAHSHKETCSMMTLKMNPEYSTGNASQFAAAKEIDEMKGSSLVASKQCSESDIDNVESPPKFLDEGETIKMHNEGALVLSRSCLEPRTGTSSVTLEPSPELRMDISFPKNSIEGMIGKMRHSATTLTPLDCRKDASCLESRTESSSQILAEGMIGTTTHNNVGDLKPPAIDNFESGRTPETPVLLYPPQDLEGNNAAHCTAIMRETQEVEYHAVAHGRSTKMVQSFSMEEAMVMINEGREQHGICPGFSSVSCASKYSSASRFIQPRVVSPAESMVKDMVDILDNSSVSKPCAKGTKEANKDEFDRTRLPFDDQAFVNALSLPSLSLSSKSSSKTQHMPFMDDRRHGMLGMEPGSHTVQYQSSLLSEKRLEGHDVIDLSQISAKDMMKKHSEHLNQLCKAYKAGVAIRKPKIPKHYQQSSTTDANSSTKTTTTKLQALEKRLYEKESMLYDQNMLIEDLKNQLSRQTYVISWQANELARQGK